MQITCEAADPDGSVAVPLSASGSLLSKMSPTRKLVPKCAIIESYSRWPAPDSPSLGPTAPSCAIDGDAKRVEQWYGSGEDILAVADGAVVSIHDGMPDKSCVNYCPSKRLYRRLNK